MKRWKKSDDLILDDYYEEDDFDYTDDENFYNSQYNDVDYEDDSDDYESFFKVRENDSYYDSDDDNSYEAEEKSINNKSSNSMSDVINILSIISKWFIRIGVVIMIILIAVFLIQWKIKTLFLYILGLIFSFILGYLFMYFLVMFTENN